MGGLRDHHSHGQVSAGLCWGIFAITLGLLCQAFSWVPGVEAVNGLQRPVLRFNNEGTFKILQVQIELLLLLLLPNPMPFLYPSFMLLNVCFHLHGFGIMAWENLGGGETNTDSGTCFEEFFSFVLDITFLCRLRICTMEMDQERLVEI